MFSEILGSVSAHLLPARRVPLLVRPDTRACAARSRLRDEELRHVDLSDAVPGDGAAMERLRSAHVRRLTALVSDAQTDAAARQAAASIHALLNLATWTDVSRGDPFRYDPQPADEAFSETCAALSVALHLFRGPLTALSPLLPKRAEAELRRRMTAPLSTGSLIPPSLRAACHLLTAALLGEADESVRWTAIDRLCADLDRRLAALPADGSVPGGLVVATDAAIRLMNAAELLFAATEGRVDLRRHERIACMADYPLFSHLNAGWFLDPGEHSMKPELDCESLFRFGVRAGDGALTDMAAWLVRMDRMKPAEDALSRALNRATASALDEAPGRVRLFRDGFLPDAGLMFLRCFHMSAMMTGATNTPHADAGSICLFLRERPVLVDIGPGAADTSLHSLPVIGGFGQRCPLAASRTEIDCGAEDVSCCSVNLTAAYPEAARLSDYQRTLLAGSKDRPGIRLMDMMELTEPMPVEYHFICAEEPVIEGAAARLGPVRLRWDPSLRAESAPVAGHPVWNLTLRADAAPRHRAVFEFVPEPA